MVEAALALLMEDVAQVTGRAADRMPLLEELTRPVRTLNGRALFESWQPDWEDPRKDYAGSLFDAEPST